MAQDPNYNSVDGSPDIWTTEPVAPPQKAAVSSWDPNKWQSIVGRAPTQAETDYYSNTPDWLAQTTANTHGSVASGLENAGGTGAGTPPPTTGAAGGPWGAAGNPQGFINQELQAVQSTDDPGYWQNQASKDPKFMAGDPGAIAWWKDAIERGDGSMLVKNGTLQKRGGGSSPSAGLAFGGMSSGSAWQNVPLPSSFAAPSMPTAASRDPRYDQLYNALLTRSSQSLNVNPNDPIIRNQTDAFRNAQTRGSRENLSAVAEAAGPNANISAETRHANEVVGQNTAGFQAQLMQHEVDARRQEIAAALSGQMGIMSQQDQDRLREEDQALQGRQMQLNAQMGESQVSLANSQGNLQAQQQQWMQAFQAAGFDAQTAQQAWDDQYKTLFG